MNITEYIVSNFSKIKKSGERKLSKNLLANLMWVQINDDSEDETMFIFKENNSLLISVNGQITRCSYEFVVDSDTIVINDNTNEILYYVALVQDDFLILNHSFLNKVIIFANKTKHKDFVKKILNTYFEEQVKFKSKQNSRTLDYTEPKKTLTINELNNHLSREAKYHFDRNEFKEALDYYEKLLDTSPHNREFKIQKCYCLAHLGKGIQCAEEIKKLKLTGASIYRKCFNILTNSGYYYNSFELLSHSIKYFNIHEMFNGMTLQEFKDLIKVYGKKGLHENAISILFKLEESKAISFLKEINKASFDSDFEMLNLIFADDLEEYFSIKRKTNLILDFYPENSKPSSLIQIKQEMEELATKEELNTIKNNLTTWNKTILNSQDQLFEDLKSKYVKFGLNRVSEMENVLLTTNYKNEEFRKFNNKLKSKRKINSNLPYLIIAFIITVIIYIAYRDVSQIDIRESEQLIERNKTTEKVNYDAIRGYIKASDSRNFHLMKSYIAPNLKRYWALNEPTLIELEKELKRVWSLTTWSKNEINKISTIDKANRIYHLNTQYYYKTKQGKNKSINSIVEYQFDRYNKIKYINKASY